MIKIWLLAVLGRGEGLFFFFFLLKGEELLCDYVIPFILFISSQKGKTDYVIDTPSRKFYSSLLELGKHDITS